MDNYIHNLCSNIFLNNNIKILNTIIKSKYIYLDGIKVGYITPDNNLYIHDTNDYRLYLMNILYTNSISKFYKKGLIHYYKTPTNSLKLFYENEHYKLNYNNLTKDLIEHLLLDLTLRKNDLYKLELIRRYKNIIHKYIIKYKNKQFTYNTVFIYTYINFNIYITKSNNILLEYYKYPNHIFSLLN